MKVLSSRQSQLFSRMTILLWMALMLISGITEAQEAGTLTLKIRGIKEPKGNMLIALFTENEEFMSDSAYLGLSTPVTQDGTLEVDIDLPQGSYAVTLYHDVNGDQELNTSFLGVPSEPYGFSNNAMGLFGPPKFEDALVSLETPDKTLDIRLR